MPMGQRSITRLNALVKGEIDATTSNEDNIFDLERRGEIKKVRVLADNESLKLFIGGGVDFAVTRNLLRNSRPLVKGFVQALCEAVALARRERGEADRIYTRYLNVKDPALAGVHVPHLRARRDPAAAASEVGKRRARH